jgi:hypothetical protein
MTADTPDIIDTPGTIVLIHGLWMTSPSWAALRRRPPTYTSSVALGSIERVVLGASKVFQHPAAFSAPLCQATLHEGTSRSAIRLLKTASTFYTCRFSERSNRLLIAH